MGERLLTDGVMTLRAVEKADAAEIVECLDGDPEIARWLDQMPQPYDARTRSAYFGGTGESAFAVIDAETGRLLGSIGVQMERGAGRRRDRLLGRADARGRGVITRALASSPAVGVRRGSVARAAAARRRRERRRRAARPRRPASPLEGVLREAHWNARLGRRQDWAMYSVLPGEL